MWMGFGRGLFEVFVGQYERSSETKARKSVYFFIIIIIFTFSFLLSSVSYLLVIYFMFISKKMLLN